jgi:drug/metabolite transporter (DMT)-like permease
MDGQRTGTAPLQAYARRAVRRDHLAFVALAAASFLYGVTFVVVKDAVALTPPIGFVGWRFLLGATALFLIARPAGKRIWREGSVAGMFLLAGYALQTQGLTSTTASNSGLITGLYVVFTPLLAAGVARRVPRPWVVVGAMIAFAGLAFLTLDDMLRPQRGDALTVGAALAYAAHIVYLSRVAHRHPVLAFTAIQALVTALGALGYSALIEGLEFPGRQVWPAVLITGLAVSAGAFLLQVWAQTVVGPARTAIILALEPAFAAGSAAVFLAERLSPSGWAGAGLILLGIYIVLGATGDEDSLPAAEAITPAH